MNHQSKFDRKRGKFQATAISPGTPYRIWELLQRFIAGGALIVLSPVILLMWILTKATSKGPFLFQQQRPGREGKPFTVYKVRTMRPGSETKTALGVTSSDPQVTTIGKVLRVLKLDELPQLWNIVKGDMKLVGPRPIPMPLDAELRRSIPGFERRYQVAPGLTSIGQICVQDNSLGDKLVKDWELRFEGELHYIRNRSISYDVFLVLLTSLFVSKKLLPPTAQREGTTPSFNAEAQILEIPIAALSYEKAIERFSQWIERKEHHFVGVCNVHSVTMAGWTPPLREALLHSGLNTADGVPLVWTQRLMGLGQAERVYGPTLMLETLQHAEEKEWKIAFYGGHKDRLPILLENLRERFPKIEVVEAISPPFRDLTEEEDREYTNRLASSGADIIWVGIGCPKQEIWMHEHSPKIPGVMIGVGAAFDFHAGSVRQAPTYLQRLGMEWAFRLACEPKRLFKRYVTTNPIFLFRLFRQLIREGLRTQQLHPTGS
ncbi:MAG: WecB/TagA/CpsF family glycosyltransferase [Verrucomicrobiota bacterium]